MASIEKTLFFPENYLRHIDSGDISLVNGKTEGIDGMIKTTFPLLHDFLFLFSECLICFALKHFSGMNELCMIRCSSQINVNLSDCQSFTGQEYSSFNIVETLKETCIWLLRPFKRAKFHALIDLPKLQFLTFQRY